MHRPKAATGEIAEDGNQGEGKNGRESVPNDSFHSLLEENKPEDKKHEDKSGPGLDQGLFLAKKIPKKVETEVQNH